MSALTTRARLMAEFTEDGPLIIELCDDNDELRRQLAAALADLVDGHKNAAAIAWDSALKAMRYADGTPLEHDQETTLAQLADKEVA